MRGHCGLRCTDEEIGLERSSSLPKVIRLKSGVILLVPGPASLNKFSQVSVLEKFKSISFSKLRDINDFIVLFLKLTYNKIHSLQCSFMAFDKMHSHLFTTTTKKQFHNSPQIPCCCPLCSQTLLFSAPDND